MRTRITAALLFGMVTVGTPALATLRKGGEAANTQPAAIPDQPYYPAGYRDLRVAATAQQAAFPRDLRLLTRADPNERPQYDLIDCTSEDIASSEHNPLILKYGELAIELSRISYELGRLGYAREIYEGPLLSYEKDVLADPALLSEYARGELRDAQKEREEANDAEQSSVSAEDADIALKPDRLTRLAAEMDALRLRLQPHKPKIVVDGGCGGGETPFVIRLVPASGQLWLINAFAFNLCARRVPDPWNHQACPWNEIGSNERTAASGRYMFEARWPDGTVHRGAKLLEGTSEDQTTTIVFRKN